MPSKQRKIAIMGFRSVGKSSLTIQFVEGRFVDAYEPTIENTFAKNIKVKGQEYSLKLVDTAGQDELSIFPQSYSMDIHGYVLVYSINSNKSFEIIKMIYQKLLEMTGKIQVPIVLVANKVDLHLERVVSYEEGKKTATLMGAEFLEVSAKHNQDNKCSRAEALLKKPLPSTRNNFEATQAGLTSSATTPQSLQVSHSVSDIFSTVICEIEKANGNIQEKSSCLIS